jgi:hypothetical protein
MSKANVRRKDGVWEVLWLMPDGTREIAGASAHSIDDAWRKTLEWHLDKAADALRRELNNNYSFLDPGKG